MASMGSMTAMEMPSFVLSASMPTGTGKHMSSMGDMDMTCKISMLWNWYTIDSCFISKAWHVNSRGMFAGSCIGVVLMVLCLELLRRLGREYDTFILRRARMRQMYLSGSSSGIPASLLPKKIKRQGKNAGAEGSSNTPVPKTSHSQPESADDFITPVVAPVSNNSNGKSSVNDNTVAVTPTGRDIRRTDITTDALAPYRPSLVEQIVRALLHTLQFAMAYFIMLLAMYYNGYIIICIFIGAFVGSLIFSWEPISPSKENDATAVTKCCG